MTQAPEFTRPVPVERIGSGGLTRTVSATEAECVALARRLGVPAVRSLSATFHLTRGTGGRIAAAASLAGRLVRDCVVSLEPFETDIAEEFALLFVPSDDLPETIELEGADEIPYAGGTIDLGEAAAEQVALTLDPYPKKPGATLPDDATQDAESPFAVLAQRDRPH